MSTADVNRSGVIGLEDLGARHFSVPRLMLCQPTSLSEGKVLGTFYSSLLDLGGDMVNWVPLRVWVGRAFFDDQSRGMQLRCSSEQGLVPDVVWPAPPSDLCSSCSLSAWDGRTRPPCGERYSFFGYDLLTRVVFTISFHGAAIKQVRSLLTAIVMGKSEARAIYGYRIEMTSQFVTEGSRKYYIPKFAVSLLGEAQLLLEAREAREASVHMSGLSLSARRESPEEPGEDSSFPSFDLPEDDPPSQRGKRVSG